jgi:hypothetical protein
MSTERSTFAWHEIEFWSDGFTKQAVWSICRKEKIAGRNVNGKEGSKCPADISRRHLDKALAAPSDFRPETKLLQTALTTVTAASTSHFL